VPDALVSPNHFDVVDHLIDAVHPDNRFLGKLLVVKVWHLASEEKPTTVVLAPNPVKGQMRLAVNSLFGYVRRIAGASRAF